MKLLLIYLNLAILLLRYWLPGDKENSFQYDTRFMSPIQNLYIFHASSEALKYLWIRLVKDTENMFEVWNVPIRIVQILEYTMCTCILTGRPGCRTLWGVVPDFNSVLKRQEKLGLRHTNTVGLIRCQTVTSKFHTCNKTKQGGVHYQFPLTIMQG